MINSIMKMQPFVKGRFMQTTLLCSIFSARNLLAAIAVFSCLHVAQAANHKNKRKVPRQKTTVSQQVTGDYIVALVNSAPVTNQEVNQRASEIANALSASKQKTPPRQTLLMQALDELIIQKAAIQSVRDTTLTITPEELRNAETKFAQQGNVSVDVFRQRVMRKRRVNQAQYEKELTDQLLLEKMRKSRVAMASENISQAQMLQWVREQDNEQMVNTQRHIRHILLRSENGIKPKAAHKKLRHIRQRIARGKISFEDAARKYSHDNSATQGGDLGWTPVGVFVPEFDAEIAKLNTGDMTQPFTSRFGVHLAQLLDVRSQAMTEEQKLQLARQVLQEQKAQAALQKWESEVRSSAYIETRKPPR